jgi:hypothetical protein
MEGARAPGEWDPFRQHKTEHNQQTHPVNLQYRYYTRLLDEENLNTAVLKNVIKAC